MSDTHTQHAAPDETADHVAPRSKATTPAVQLERVVEVTCDPADLPVHQHVDRRMLGHGAGVLSLAGGREHEELLLSGSKDCTCRLWDLEAGKCVRTIVAHSDAVRSAKFSLDDRLVFTAGDHCVRVWDRLSPREVACFKGHHGHVTDVDVQMRQLGSISYGLTMVSASFDCTLRVWDLRAQLAIRSCVGHSKPVTSCALMPDGKTVVSGGLDAVARFFDAAAITANVPYSLTNPMTQARQLSLSLSLSLSVCLSVCLSLSLSLSLSLCTFVCMYDNIYTRTTRTRAPKNIHACIHILYSLSSALPRPLTQNFSHHPHSCIPTSVPPPTAPPALAVSSSSPAADQPNPIPTLTRPPAHLPALHRPPDTTDIVSGPDPPLSRRSVSCSSPLLAERASSCGL